LQLLAVYVDPPTSNAFFWGPPARYTSWSKGQPPNRLMDKE